MRKRARDLRGSFLALDLDLVLLSTTPTGVYVIQNLAIELRKRTVHLATQPRTILNMNIHELLILPVPGFWNAQGPVRTR